MSAEDGADAAPDAPSDLGAVEEALGHRFRDRARLELALTHASASFEREGTRGNERLEFLGDAVLDLAVSGLLYAAHPDWTEGDLTRARAALVNTGQLAARARTLGLGEAARLGRTFRDGGGRDRDSILANLLEAVLAAVYLDGGLAPVEALVRRVFPEAADPDAPPPPRDAKTRLNEWAHARGGQTPRYRTLEDRGEAGGARRFRAAVELGGERLGEGEGATKRAAERAAARQALLRADEEP